jgi:N-acetylmuramoyl-L-alanine amidase
MKIVNFRLEGANWKASPNYGGIIKPELIVIHYTGSNSLQGALSWLCDPKAKVSAHLLIAKTGQIWQLVPFNRRAWHAGRSEYLGRPDVNSFSIGIENVGLGDEWPEAQIQANIDVINAIREVYDIVDIVGHDEICIPTGRKTDPGPNYPWKRVGDACGFEWEEV